MFALVLRYKATVGSTPLGILVLHETYEPVLVGTTPLSKVLLRDYDKGIKFFVYDRSLHVRKEVVVPPKNYAKFMNTAPLYYQYAKMELEQRPFDTDNRIIIIDGTSYEVGEIIR
jgi:hypothetical protein